MTVLVYRRRSQREAGHARINGGKTITQCGAEAVHWVRYRTSNPTKIMAARTAPALMNLAVGRIVSSGTVRSS